MNFCGMDECANGYLPLGHPGLRNRSLDSTLGNPGRAHKETRMFRLLSLQPPALLGGADCSGLAAPPLRAVDFLLGLPASSPQTVGTRTVLLLNLSLDQECIHCSEACLWDHTY